MAYRNKEETIKIAEKLGIDVSEMTWPEMQKAVSSALKANNNDNRKTKKYKNVKRKLRYNDAMVPYFKYKLVMGWPEIASDPKRYAHYEEKLGDDLEIEEKSFLGLEGGGINWQGSGDVKTGTFKVKGKSGRRVVATTGVPRESAGVSWDLGNVKEMIPVIEFKGRKGYAYRHPGVQSFRSLIDELNLYEDYRSTILRHGVLFYLSGILCIDIGVANSILDDIERRASREDIHSWGL